VLAWIRFIATAVAGCDRCFTDAHRHRIAEVTPHRPCAIRPKSRFASVVGTEKPRRSAAADREVRPYGRRASIVTMHPYDDTAARSINERRRGGKGFAGTVPVNAVR
jgi:hypothetical protein